VILKQRQKKSDAFGEKNNGSSEKYVKNVNRAKTLCLSENANLDVQKFAVRQ